MTVAKPTLEEVRWGETAGDSGTESNLIEPVSGKKDAAWANAEEPDAGHTNWILNRLYKWARYVDAITNPNAHTNEGPTAWYVAQQLIVGTYATISGVLTVGKSVIFGSVAAGSLTPTAIAAFSHNYAPTGFADAFQLRIEASTGVAGLTGLAGGQSGRMIVLHNVGATNAFAIVHEAAASTAANRFALSSGADLAVPVGGSATLVYDGDASRWRCVGLNF